MVKNWNKEVCYLGVMFDSLAVKETASNQRIDQYGKTVGLLFPLLKDKYLKNNFTRCTDKTIQYISNSFFQESKSWSKYLGDGRLIW